MLRESLCCVAVGGETEEEKIRVDILENEAMDMSNQLATVCYSPYYVSCLLLSWSGQALLGAWTLSSTLVLFAI